MTNCPHCTNGVVELLFSRRACEYCAGGVSPTEEQPLITSTRTGRISCGGPNLQNVPRAKPAFSFPEGSHECTVVSVKQRVSKTGRPMVEWTLRTDAGTDHRLFQALSGPNMWAIAESAKACGLGNGEALDHAVGRRVRIEAKGEHRIRWCEPTPEGYVHAELGESRTATLQLVEEGTGIGPSMLRANATFRKTDGVWLLAEDVEFPSWRGMMPIKVAAVFVDDRHKVPLDSSIFLSEGDSARFAAGALTVGYLR